jgi:hypothetical protein
LGDYNNIYISFGICPSFHSSSPFSLDLPEVMDQPQSILSGTHSEYNIAPDEISNTSTNDTQLQRLAQNPHQKAADMATINMYNDEKLTILGKSTAKTKKRKYAVGCMLFNHIT